MRKLIQSGIISLACMLLTACASDAAETDDVETESITESVEVVKTMTGKMLGDLVLEFDKDAQVSDNRVTFELRERELLIVYDSSADRMRILTPILQAGAVPQEVFERMLQANFDAVLDPSYAVANDIVWAVFLHRLSTLTEEDFKSAIAQTYTAAETFGTTYTSGAMVFGGGDSNSLHEELLEELENRPTKENQGI